MTMLLDVLWADWSVEQIDGIRGGGKSRVCQGKYSRLGDHDSYRGMADILLGPGAWTRAKYGHTNSGYVYCLATSRYRFNDFSAPVLLVAATQERYDTADQFCDYLETIDCASDHGMLSVRFLDADNRTAELTFDSMQKTLPMVNGSTIDLNPSKVYDCHFMSSDFGSGVVTMGQDEDAYVWNMHDNSIQKQGLRSPSSLSRP